MSEKNILLHSYILMVHNIHNKGRWRRFGMGVQNHRESDSPAWSRGGALVGGLGDKSPRSWRILKVRGLVTSKFYAFLVVIHTCVAWNQNTDYWKRKLRSTTL